MSTLPLPVIDPDNAEFWAACKRHELVLQRCADCKALRHPPRPMCHVCTSMKAEWVRASGKGRVYSYVIIVQPIHPGLVGKVPLATAQVRLDEGLIFNSNVVGCDPNDVKIDMRVEVTFEDVTAEITLPKFRPVR